MFKTIFSREIGLILVVKLLLLYGLWTISFKETKQKIVSAQLADRLLDQNK